MKKIAIAVAVLLAGAALAYALNPKTHESFGIRRYYEARTSEVSTHTVAGMLMSWSVTSVGGTADFEIKHTTTPANPLNDPNVNVSSTMYVLDGQQIEDEVDSVVINPIIYIKRIDAGTTVYVDMAYLFPRQGEF